MSELGQQLPDPVLAAEVVATVSPEQSPEVRAAIARMTAEIIAAKDKASDIAALRQRVAELEAEVRTCRNLIYSQDESYRALEASRARLARCAAALVPFASVYRLNASLNLPDDLAAGAFAPKAWPTFSAYREAEESLAALQPGDLACSGLESHETQSARDNAACVAQTERKDD